ncbi:hypothetical protein F2Q69_00037445 [Brassica cretica]|uniref:Uncharacterized protein n=1 Tax=Brassica cretica TaxID=69181 RepID=A0A8S9SJS4_BRACR|nr:hypothetical protein F2Q69_00037445 [Brassica cretica]
MLGSSRTEEDVGVEEEETGAGEADLVHTTTGGGFPVTYSGGSWGARVLPSGYNPSLTR